jgi:hypothetical protein
MRLVEGTIRKIIESGDDLQRLEVTYVDRSGQLAQAFAISYPILTGPCAVDEVVLLNATAVDLGLGTGGVLFVVTRLTGNCRVLLDAPAVAGGHVMKLRYTPLQRDVLAVEEQASPYHEAFKGLDSLEGVPVVCCELHSQVPLVAAAVKSLDPTARVAYCWTDQAALLLAFSDILRSARGSGLIDTTISCGQALGGDHEAVTLHSGLLAARHIAAADVVIVGIGPGIVGTGTAFGHGGVAQGEALNAAAALKGVAIAPLRLSFADQRERHSGVSHHSICALRDICLTEAMIPIPTDLPAAQQTLVETALEGSGINERHGVIEVDVNPDMIDLRGLNVTTMGRTQAEDPAFFSAAFAAGILAAGLRRERL